MTNILIGTASWTDPTLVKDGHFYPPGTKSPEERLRFYASQFPIVEVDSTYYFPPSKKNAVLWIDRTPKDFTFNIKAYSLLTNHPTKRESLYKDLLEDLPDDVAGKRNLYRENLPEETVEEVWQRFHDALMPLHSAGKLGAVLFQFPQWFVIGRKNKDYILECAERLKDFRIAVEFRHKTWLEDRNAEETLSFLEEHDLPPEIVRPGEELRGPAVNAPPPSIEPMNPESARIARALERSGGSRTRAAQLLGISRVTLWRRMRELHMA